MGRNRNDLLDGIEAGTAIGAQFNQTREEQARIAEEKSALAQQLGMEQQLEQMREGSAASLQQAGFGQQQTLQQMEAQSALGLEGQTAKDRIASELALEKAMADRNTQTQTAIMNRQAQLNSHALQDDFDGYYSTLAQYQQEAKQAQASGDPDAINIANSKLQQWQARGDQIFQQANKNQPKQGLQVEVDPSNPKGSFKVTGTVNNIDDALKLRDAMAPQASQGGVAAALDQAIAQKQQDLATALSANPSGGKTAGDYIPFVGGGQAAIQKAQSDLQALQQQRAALGGAPAGSGGAMPTQVQPGGGMQLPSGGATTLPPQVQPGGGMTLSPTAQLGAAPPAINPMGPSAPNPASTGQQALQYSEGMTAINPQTGDRMVFHNGTWTGLNQ